MEEALKYASKTLGRKVVRVLNPYGPTDLYLAFMHVVVKNGSRNSSRLLDIVRSSTEGMIKKASLGPRRSDATRDSEEENGYKKGGPQRHKERSPYTNVGGLKIGSAKVSNTFDSAKSF